MIEKLFSHSQNEILNLLATGIALKIDDSVITDKEKIAEIIAKCTYQNHQKYLSYTIVNITFEGHKMLAKIKLKSDKIISVVMESLKPKIRYRLDLQYDGTKYQGFQKQPHRQTIQDTLENCLSHLCQEVIQIHPASRTDTHVHAEHQVVHFDTHSSLPKEKIIFLLNEMLPKDIYVIHIQDVPQVFHARYDTLKKTYRYLITKSQAPFEAHHKHYLSNFDKTKAKTMLSYIKGTHDFRNFSKVSSEMNTIRTIEHIDITEKDTFFIIEITGNGFLRHMVRMVLGHLFYSLKNTEETFYQALDQPQQIMRKYLAPAHALYLHKIFYE